jgi:uncharacterized protein (DUF1501 family)
MIVDRRQFLRRSIASALGGVSLYSALGNLKLVEAATKGMVFNDYKALVCVFLHGGNDSFNTVVPYDAAHYDVYAATRPAMQIAQAGVQANALTPLPTHLPGDGGSYGLHPNMSALRTLFNQQRAAIVANVGPLLQPLTKQQYQANPSLAPPQLFSHDDQANFWQTSRPDDANADGWGGRIADLLHAGNPNPQLSMTMSLSSQSLFQRGSSVDQYVLAACSSDGSSCGVDGIGYLGEYQNELGTEAFDALMAQGTQAHLFERAYADGTRRAIANYQALGAVLNPLPAWTVPFPQSGLGAQLRQVANLINVRDALGMRRQIFFVSQGGYDTHDDQAAVHPALLADLSASLDAFYRATVQMGVANGVTAFTASDFGRTLSTNGDGTDHGWGGHHFVLGGAVQGGRFFGRMPSLAQVGNPDDAGYGQLIPTTSVDQYAATLARWFGVADGDLPTLFPRLSLFDTSDLGFMA